MGCLSCGRFLHDECMASIDGVCCCKKTVVHEDDVIKPNAGNSNGDDAPRPRGRPPKNDELLENPLATWRKRASMEFPLSRDEPCEWRGLRNVGGGKYPIVGCTSGKQQNIHHGPVKITIGFCDDEGKPFNFNREGNIHRICGRCHNLWHHWNDAPYDPIEWARHAHSPTEATPTELLTWSNAASRPVPPFPRTTPRKVDEE